MSEAAGRGARAIRQAAGVTLATFAKAAKTAGLPWSTGRVGDFESGRIAPSLPTLIAVAGALSHATKTAVSLPDLFADDGEIRVNDRLTLRAERLRELLQGNPFEIVLGDLTDKDELQAEFHESLKSMTNALGEVPLHLRKSQGFFEVIERYSEGDTRIARSLGVNQYTAAAAMDTAWGKTFVERRDELAGPGANAQRKGIITRKLKAELKAVINGDD